VRKNLACLTQQKYKILEIEKKQASATTDASGDVEMIDTSAVVPGQDRVQVNLKF
jgi:hypothetical protein